MALSNRDGLLAWLDLDRPPKPQFFAYCRLGVGALTSTYFCLVERRRA
jgi:hypothetical protein